MTEIERIADQMQRAFRGEAWHGPAVMELLSGVTEAQAAARRLPAAHTIWEIVLHITAWKLAPQRMLRGEEVHLTDAEDWPVPSGTWEAAIQELERAHAGLLELVNGLTEERLAERIAGRDYGVYFLLHGLVQHDLYHAGQIAVLKKG